MSLLFLSTPGRADKSYLQKEKKDMGQWHNILKHSYCVSRGQEEYEQKVGIVLVFWSASAFHSPEVSNQPGRQEIFTEVSTFYLCLSLKQWVITQERNCLYHSFRGFSYCTLWSLPLAFQRRIFFFFFWYYWRDTVLALMTTFFVLWL